MSNEIDPYVDFWFASELKIKRRSFPRPLQPTNNPMQKSVLEVIAYSRSTLNDFR